MLRRLAAGPGRAWAAYSRLLDAYPLPTKAATAFAIFTSADAIRQRIESYTAERPHTWDAARTMRLAGFYATVHASWIHFWYAFLDKHVGRSAAVRVVALKVCADQFFSMPIFMATLLACQTLLSGHGLDYVKAKLERDWVPTVKGAWVCWIPSLTVAFAFVPLKYRLLYANCVQVLFGIWISKQANSPIILPAKELPDTDAGLTSAPSPTPKALLADRASTAAPAAVSSLSASSR
eukprot:m.237365 g.237365  ORF g.237365 m.237365 type:complete len:236 (+) comp13124_c0_seq1:10-717(+)